MSTEEYGPWQCCRWHRTGGSGLRICNDRDARSLTGEPMPPFALFAPSPTLRTYEQGVADERAAVVAWLREVHAKYRSTKVGITSYGSVAQDIERGSHRADSKAAEVNRDQRDDGAQAQPAGAAAAPTGQAGGEQSSPAGLPAGLTCEDVGCPCEQAVDLVLPGAPAGLSPLSAAVEKARGGPPPPHLGAGATAGYTSPAFRTGFPAGPYPKATIRAADDPLWVGPHPANPSPPLVSRFWKRSDGHLLLLVPGGITPEDLRAQGFPDVAARLEGGDRG